MANFTCEWCEEEYDISLRFEVSGIVIGNKIHEVVCPDCIAAWFQEAPEQIEKITIDRCIN